MPRSRDETLALLRGQRLSRLPVFGGLPGVTAPGLAQAGVRYAEAHGSPGGMARAAASTFELFGYESAVAPLDMCVEAEALGAEIDFQADSPAFGAPIVAVPLPVELDPARWRLPEDVARAGRLPIVADALRELKAGVGREIAVGAWVPGPFTLAWQLFGAEAWLTRIADPLAPAFLDALADFLGRVARHYREAGADFLTVHEMGGSPQAVGPRTFQKLVRPPLARLLAGLPDPAVLSVCGNTNAVMPELAACGASALNVDHTNDLARSRAALGPEAVLLGNFDPVGTLSHGAPETVARAVRAAAEAGVSALWPGCDLWPEIPAANFEALMRAAREPR